MQEQLLEAIPEFNLIQDADLREKTLKVWEEAMLGGGWQVSDLEKMPFTLLIPDCPANMIMHVRGVTQTAIAIADVFEKVYGKALPVKRDYLIAGGILHDVGKMLEYEKVDGKFVKSPLGKSLRHPFSGTCIAYKFGIPAEVMHLIAAHSKEGDHGARSVEGVIINHADFVNFESLKA
ncbi:HD domain-containing protein [Candidatus Riflebacteria bacterium]